MEDNARISRAATEYKLALKEVSVGWMRLLAQYLLKGKLHYGKHGQDSVA